jgi:hypothetical protein
VGPNAWDTPLAGVTRLHRCYWKPSLARSSKRPRSNGLSWRFHLHSARNERVRCSGQVYRLRSSGGRKSRQVSLGKGEEKGLRAYYWKNPGVGGQRSSPLTYPRGLPVYVTASQQAPFIVDLTMRMKKNGKHPRTKKSKPERIFCSIGACARVLDP